MLNSMRVLVPISILAGAALPIAFAPHHCVPLAILSPAILLWIWQKTTAKEALMTGFGYGLGVFGMGVSWVYVSIHDFGNTDIPLAVLITSLLVIMLALFFAVQGYVLSRLYRTDTVLFSLLRFPSAWVLFEWVRSWLFTGFPWLYLGYSQLGSPLSAYAPIASVYGVSFAVVLTSGTLVTLCKGNSNAKILATIMVALLWGGGFLGQERAYTTLEPHPYTVSLIQGNIKPFDKFTQAEPIRSTEQTYGRLSEKEWGRDLILWPESAIPLALPYAEDYVQHLQNVAAAHHSTLITGIQVVKSNGMAYNALIALGNGEGLYHKYHLLPFGDFLPFEKWLRGLINFFDLPNSSFSNGDEDQPLISAGTLKLDPLICYEIAFPELVRKTLRNADAIITLSEDGWFGKSWGPHQHLQIAQMRALETGRYVLRATTSGITAIIDPKGNIAATIPAFEAMVLRGAFYSMKGNTPWVEMGLWPLLILLLVCLVIPIRPLSRRS